MMFRIYFYSVNLNQFLYLSNIQSFEIDLIQDYKYIESDPKYVELDAMVLISLENICLGRNQHVNFPCDLQSITFNTRHTSTIGCFNQCQPILYQENLSKQAWEEDTYRVPRYKYVCEKHLTVLGFPGLFRSEFQKY